MSRRVEIELTSRTAEGSYTWRAAGAKQPRGVVSQALLPTGASVGDVLRADLESDIDGFAVVAVLARPESSKEQPSNRIEVLGAPRRGPDVSVSYANGGRRRREGFGDEAVPPRGRGARRPRPDEPREPRRASGPRHEGPREGRRPTANADGEPGVHRARSPRAERPRRASSGAPGERAPERVERERRAPDTSRRDRRQPTSTTHRNAMLAQLGPQELPIAEQLLRGGIPAVRQAIADNMARPGAVSTKANADTVLAIAEQLLPRVNLASWKDRASAAQSAGKELRLRDLRAVVSSSRAVTLDDEGRSMARALRESLDLRVKALRDEWLARMGRLLDEHRVADALRLSSTPPEPATRLPAELAVRLAEAAGAAMTAATPHDEWRSVLDAVVGSPVRRNVKPQGIPDDAALRDAARHAAGSVPELAKHLGLRIPPPPPPPRRPVRAIAPGGAGSRGGR